MTDYGQSIPPAWFRDTTPKQFSKSAFMAYLHRALVTAGMKEIVSLSPAGWDANDPSQDEHVMTSNVMYMWFYDFPTSETFTFNNQQYRPIFAIGASFADTGTSSPATTIYESMAVQVLYRRADRIVTSDFIGFNNQMIDSANFGFGNTFTSISEWSGQEGAYRYFPKWIPYRGYPLTAGAYTQLQGTRNFHVFLGRGGLLIQIGSGDGKTDNNDILSFLCLFGGARVPGRARIPANDFNLNRINPTLALPLASQSDGRYYSTSIAWSGGTLIGTRPASYVLGMQHDRKFTNQPVLAIMMNLENAERPLLPVGDIDTKSSPRTLQIGGAHVLVRLEYITWLRAGSSTDFYGPLDPTVRAEPVPSIFDVWTAPAFRICDRTAPIGVYLDPTPASPGPAGIHWFMFRAAGVNAIYAVDAEGVTKHTAFALPSVTQLNDYHLDLAVGGFSGPFTPTTVITQTTDSGGPGTWAATSSTDEALLDWNQNPSIGLVFHITVPTITADIFYKMSMELFNKCDAARTFGSGSDPVTLEYSLDGGSSWSLAGNTAPVQGVNLFENTGTDNTKPYYAYTAVPQIRIPQQASDSTIWFRIRTHQTINSDPTPRHVGVRNIHLVKYQRS